MTVLANADIFKKMIDCLYLSYPIIDITVAFNGRFPIEEKHTLGVSEVSIVAGGAANTLFMGARLGICIAPYGAVGDDLYGRLIIETYAGENVPTTYVSTCSEIETSKVIIPLSQDGKHCFLSMLGGSYGDLSRLEEAVCSSRSIIVSGYQLYEKDSRDTIFAYVALARKHKKTVFFDPGPMIQYVASSDISQLLVCSDVIICNDEEATLITDETDVELAAAAIARRTEGLVVVKAGPRGCFIRQGDASCWHPAFSVSMIDTTGAGDAFLAAFIAGYLRGWDVNSIAEVANAVGAAKAAKRGCGTLVPTVEEVIAVLQQRSKRFDTQILTGKKPL